MGSRAGRLVSIPVAVAALRARLGELERAAGSPAGAVRLIAVSKRQSAAQVRAAHGAGVRDFGENQLQEALPKMAALTDLDICWHFIGTVQANKTRAIADHFHWVHSIDREKIARRLQEQRPPGMPLLNVCVQVNISGEAGKSGVTPAQAGDLCQAIAALPALRLRGLMAVPAATADEAWQRASFQALATLARELRPRFPAMDTLSMGMSGDFAAAIAEGATMIRIGTAIFGARS